MAALRFFNALLLCVLKWGEWSLFIGEETWESGVPPPHSWAKPTSPGAVRVWTVPCTALEVVGVKNRARTGLQVLEPVETGMNRHGKWEKTVGPAGPCNRPRGPPLPCRHVSGPRGSRSRVLHSGRPRQPVPATWHGRAGLLPRSRAARSSDVGPIRASPVAQREPPARVRESLWRRSSASA
jgi:hypothetical protein